MMSPGCGGDCVAGKFSHSAKNFTRGGTQADCVRMEHGRGPKYLPSSRTTSLVIEYCISFGYPESKISEIQRKAMSPVPMASSGSRRVTATSRDCRSSAWMFPSWTVIRSLWSKRRTAVLSVSLALHEQIQCNEWGTTHILFGTYKSRRSSWSPREIAAMRKQFVLRMVTF